MTIFIDRLYINQEFVDGQAPDLFDGHVARYDVEGVQEWLAPSAAVMEGSFDTRILAKSWAGRSFIRGNPGRFGRPDNVFNLDWHQTWEKTNRLCDRFGMRRFEFGQQTYNVSERDAKYGVLSTWTGATVSALDLTCNFSTGSKENAFLFLQWLEGQHVERVRGGVSRHGSVRFGDKGLQVEAYYKAEEILAHAKNEQHRKEIKKSDLFQWLNDFGIVRLEVRAKTDHLRDRNLRYAGGINMAKIIKLYDEKTQVIRRISSDVDAFDFSGLSFHLAGVAREYLAGRDVRASMSVASFYRNRSKLLGYGIDIASPHKIRSILPRIKVIELTPMAAPDWYWKKAA